MLLLTGCGIDGRGGLSPSEAASMVNEIDGLSNAEVMCAETAPRFLDVGGTAFCQLEVTVEDGYQVKGAAELAEFFLQVIWSVETRNEPPKLTVTLNLPQGTKFDPVAALQANGWETTRGKYVGELWGVFAHENGYFTGHTEAAEHFGSWPGKVPAAPLGLLTLLS
ncbi:hypothetical protein [Homoserinimonas sp. OAct 916]|uniref:hypothetical protein n=1 Tax=Homoserinimonas sp. OAct 916 TaxID=2211450 RepID=UPI000DBE3FCF|nr:hypothetical protein [Homoserinimonas sp. OAct 916]